MPENIEYFLGEMKSSMNSISGKVTEISTDVKLLLNDNSTTKERLANGARHFDDNDTRLDALESKKFPLGRIITIIALGFTALGLLISITR